MSIRAEAEVVLPPGHTGSSLFHAVLTEAVAQFPQALARADFPASVAAFKPTYGEALARLEAARVGATERVDIARFIVQRTRDALRFGSATESEPLRAYLRERVATPQLEHIALDSHPGLTLEVPLEGRTYRGADIHGLVDRLLEAHQLSWAAARALHWVVDHEAASGGRLDLRGERFVLLGAGAELASTALLLRAGAEVLWVDLTAPERALAGAQGLAGGITRAPAASNLLAQPREIAAAIRAFADAGPVHVGMFAYAPGASKEWRLGAAMNAIVSSLEPGLVRSVALLISPTTPSVLSPETVRSIDTRTQSTPGWQRWLARLGAFAQPGAHHAGDVRVSLSTVSLQGLSYQAAQYISKVAAAETYAVYGIDQGLDTKLPVTVSANVAGVTRTRSMAHPLFLAAFEGAARFGVRVFDPETTRALNGALMLHDLLNPKAPGASGVSADDARAKATGVLSQQIHGGIYTLPYVLEGVIRAAAVTGLATNPKLLLPRSKARPARRESDATLAQAAE